MLATQAQFDYIKSLIASRELSGEATYKVGRARLRATQGVLTKAQASELIDLLKGQPALSLEGMHQTPDGAIYKVQRAVHGSGHLYAKRLTACTAPDEWTFQHAPGAIRLLSPATRMTREQAAAFGTLYGVCCNCGRTLTDETSIAQGYGPVCAQYFS